MSDRRQKNQLYQAFPAENRGEALKAAGEGTESLAAKRRAESPAIGEPWMEEICERENCRQAVTQVLQDQWDGTFSEHRYGFRPGRSAPQAVAQAQQYIAAGYRWVVDLDLEKFFDRVNHDRRMARLAQRIGDKRLLKLIRAFRTAGVLEDGLVSPVDEGAPQGGPLSPLLSNIVLDEFDRELERRGLRFAR